MTTVLLAAKRDDEKKRANIQTVSFKRIPKMMSLTNMDSAELISILPWSKKQKVNIELGWSHPMSVHLQVGEFFKAAYFQQSLQNQQEELAQKIS